MQQCVTASPERERERWCLKIVFTTHQHLHIQFCCRESFIEAKEMICVPPWGAVCFTMCHSMMPVIWYSIRTSQLRTVCWYLRVHICFSVIFINVLKIMSGRHSLLKQWIVSDAEHSADDVIFCQLCGKSRGEKHQLEPHSHTSVHVLAWRWLNSLT